MPDTTMSGVAQAGVRHGFFKGAEDAEIAAPRTPGGRDAVDLPESAIQLLQKLIQ